jgi:hypothetical protein
MPVSDLHRQIAVLALAAAGTLAGDGLAVAVVIERRTRPCCRGERPDPGPDPDRHHRGSREHDPHLAAAAGIVRHEDLWQLCRDELRSRMPRFCRLTLSREFIETCADRVGYSHMSKASVGRTPAAESYVDLRGTAEIVGRGLAL